MKLIKRFSISLLSLVMLLSVSAGFAPKYNSHASETNTWNITKRITSKQFSCHISRNGTYNGRNVIDNNGTDGTVYLSSLNKSVSHKVDNYLIRTRNLHNYRLYFSRVSDVNTKRAEYDTITATVTFIRK